MQAIVTAAALEAVYRSQRTPNLTRMQFAETLTIKVGRKHYAVASLAEASALYCAARDKCGFGASRVPNAPIFEGSRQIAYVSYNGRVWAGKEWQPDATPLFDNRLAAEA